MDGLLNVIKRHAAAMDGVVAQDKTAQVLSFDPVNHAVKLMLLPEQVQTGWMPCPSLSIGAAAIVAPPNIGDFVTVAPHEGDHENWHITGRLFTVDANAPTSPANTKQVQSGEIGIFVSQNGTITSYLHLTNDGTVHTSGTISHNGDIIASGTITHTGTITNTGTLNNNGDVHITGNLIVNGITMAVP